MWCMTGLIWHWQCGPRVDYSMWQYCWVPFGTPCSGWNDGTSKWHNAKDVGFWRSTPSLKKGCWLWSAQKWHIVLNSWMAWGSYANTWVWKKPWRILDWGAVHQTGEQCIIHCYMNMFWSSPKLKDKIIPAFKHMHSTGHQALIMVNNSQGHSAYSKDALLVLWMNVNPGGKQAQMHDGWFMHEDLKITQPMIFPANHLTYPDIEKGIKAILTEHGLYEGCLWGKCKKCTSDSCCGKCILELQPDFQQQKSLVQEMIEAAGHLCILLPKFHCELNFIKFFWGTIKKYLHDNCDYTFDTLKENMPKALKSVQLQTIWQWEHQMFQWMDACRAGVGTTDAQKQVKKFSSTKYKSHWHVPEMVACTFDQ